MAKSHHHKTKTNKTQHTQAGLFRMFGSDRRRCRSDGRFRRPGTAKRPNAPRTFLSATATATSLNHAPAGSPAAPPTTASSRLQCRPTVPVPVRPADRSALTPACCLRRQPRRQPTYPGSRSRPASRRNTLRSPGNSTLEPQFPAASGGSTHDAKLH